MSNKKYRQQLYVWGAGARANREFKTKNPAWLTWYPEGSTRESYDYIPDSVSILPFKPSSPTLHRPYATLYIAMLHNACRLLLATLSTHKLIAVEPLYLAMYVSFGIVYLIRAY